MHARLNSLRKQHGTLDSLIRREELHAFPDREHIRVLKKFKLRVRDEIHRIELSLDCAKTAA